MSPVSLTSRQANQVASHLRCTESHSSKATGCRLFAWQRVQVQASHNARVGQWLTSRDVTPARARALPPVEQYCWGRHVVGATSEDSITADPSGQRAADSWIQWVELQKCTIMATTSSIKRMWNLETGVVFWVEGSGQFQNQSTWLTRSACRSEKPE